MKITKLFRKLSFGELSNLAISGSGSGTIIEEKQEQLVQYVNECLGTLHSRFLLREKSLLLEQVAHITNYHLKRKFAESAGSDAEYPYIKDLPDEPFEEDVVKILGVTNRTGYQLPLNDIGNDLSLFTPQPDILQVPTPLAGEPLVINYQARHRPLDERPGKILNQDIEIPFYLEVALQSAVASKVFSHMNGQENLLKSNEYAGAYEAACFDVEQRDLVNQTFHTSHHKLEDRGFV